MFCNPKLTLHSLLTSSWEFLNFHQAKKRLLDSGITVNRKDQPANATCRQTLCNTKTNVTIFVSSSSLQGKCQKGSANIIKKFYFVNGGQEQICKHATWNERVPSYMDDKKWANFRENIVETTCMSWPCNQLPFSKWNPRKYIAFSTILAMTHCDTASYDTSGFYQPRAAWSLGG